VTESRFALLVEQIDAQVEDLNEERDRLRTEADELLVERDRLLAARQVLVAGEPPVSAVPATARRERPAPRAASPATTPTSEPSKAAPWNKGKRAPQKPRDCPVCGETFGGGPALSSHMRSKHPAVPSTNVAIVGSLPAAPSAAPAVGGRPSIDEIQALEAVL
jgi:hypothetical protein